MTTEKKKDENKAPGWAWWVLIIISIIIAVIFTGISKKEEVAGAGKASAQSWPLCAGDYDFSRVELPTSGKGAQKVEVNFRPDCRAEVSLPPCANYRTVSTADHKIRFIDGAEYISGPGKQTWFGVHKGLFTVQGLTQAGTLKIFLEQ